MRTTLVLLFAAALAAPAAGQSGGAKPVTKPAPRRRRAPFRTSLTLDEMRGKQAVVTTALGDIVIDLLPEQAPNHVGLFIKTAQEGGFTGTTFHRVVRQGIIQGGDPLTRDPATRAKAGTGGLNLLAQEGLDRAAHPRRGVGGDRARAARQRRHAVLRLHRRPAEPRREAHRLRTRQRRPAGGAAHLGGRR